MKIPATFKEKLIEYKQKVGLGNYSKTFHQFFDEGEVLSPQLIPGHFYMLEYNPINPVVAVMLPVNEEHYDKMVEDGITPITKKPYFDLNPTVLSLGKNLKGDQLVLNMRILSQPRRYMILESYWQVFKKFIDNAYEEDSNGTIQLLPFRERLSKFGIAKPFHAVNPSFLKEMLGGLNINFAINKYETEKISRVKLIDWNDVQKIPFAYQASNDPTLVISPTISTVDGLQELFELKT